MIKILIVDDNKHFRQSLKDILNVDLPSLYISESEDAVDAMEKVNHFAPNLIFMDINLASGNGLHLTQRIKKDHSNIIVFVISGHDIPEYHQAAYQAGASYFMSKNAMSMRKIRDVVEKLSLNQQFH